MPDFRRTVDGRIRRVAVTQDERDGHEASPARVGEASIMISSRAERSPYALRGVEDQGNVNCRSIARVMGTALKRSQACRGGSDDKLVGWRLDLHCHLGARWSSKVLRRPSKSTKRGQAAVAPATTRRFRVCAVATVDGVEPDSGVRRHRADCRSNGGHPGRDARTLRPLRVTVGRTVPPACVVRAGLLTE